MFSQRAITDLSGIERLHVEDNSTILVEETPQPEELDRHVDGRDVLNEHSSVVEGKTVVQGGSVDGGGNRWRWSARPSDVDPDDRMAIRI